jgi:uncharacterized protein
MPYEWDPNKERSNIAKHGVSFTLAQRIFEGPVVTLDDVRFDYGEIRSITIGQVDGVVMLTVVHTDRAGRTRIISARPASRKERMRYEQALRASPRP